MAKQELGKKARRKRAAQEKRLKKYGVFPFGLDFYGKSIDEVDLDEVEKILDEKYARGEIQLVEKVEEKNTSEEVVEEAAPAEEETPEENPSEENTSSEVIEENNEVVEEPQEEEDVEEQPEANNEVVEETKEEPEEEVVFKGVDENGLAIVARYKKSFLAKLSQSSDQTKAFYSNLKNYCLSYNVTKSSISWNFDSINSGRTNFTKFAIRGKTLCLYLGLQVRRSKAFKALQEKYHFEISKSKKYENVPCFVRLKNDRRYQYAIELIDVVAKNLGLEKGELQNENYKVPYESTAALIEKGLIKEVIQKQKMEELLEEQPDILETAEEDTYGEENREDEIVLKGTDEEGFAIVARYKKSFTAKLIQSKLEVKKQYSKLKNVAMSYKKVKSNVSWSYDSLNAGRPRFVKFAFKGKTLCIFFAIDANDVDEKYRLETTEAKKYIQTPSFIRIKNEKRFNNAIEVIALTAEKLGLAKGEQDKENYILPYEKTADLVEKGLIKEIIQKQKMEEYLEEVAQQEAIVEEEPEVIEEAPVEEEQPEVIPEPVQEAEQKEAEENAFEENTSSEVIEENNEVNNDVIEEIPAEEPAVEERPKTKAELKAEKKAAKKAAKEAKKAAKKAAKEAKKAAKEAAKNPPVEENNEVNNDVNNDVVEEAPVEQEPTPVVQENAVEEAPAEEKEKSEDELDTLPALMKRPRKVKQPDANVAIKEEIEPVKGVYSDQVLLKLKMATYEMKTFYNEFKNAINKYQDLTFNSNKNDESYLYKNNVVMRITFYQKAFYAYFALDPEKYEEDYKIKDQGDKKKYEKVPLCVKVTSHRMLNVAKKFLVILAEDLGITKNDEVPETDYMSDILSNSKELLTLQGKAELLKSYATVKNCQVLDDNTSDKCRILIKGEHIPSDEKCVGQITIGELSAAFNHNYVITLELLKEIDLVDKDANYLKVIAMGSCNKKLNVVANEFDTESQKMIILLSGNVIKIY